MQCTTKCWLLAMNQYFHPLCHYASPFSPSFSCFQRPSQTLLKKKKAAKIGSMQAVSFFFPHSKHHIKTKFREPISFGLEAISLTLFASKIHPGRRVASCGELSKMIFSGQLLGTSPGVKCLAGWSWKNSKNNSEMSQGITRRIIHQPELKFVWGSRTELPFPMRSDNVTIVGPDEYVKHDSYCLVLSHLLAASPRVPLQIKVFVVRYSGTLSL